MKQQFHPLSFMFSRKIVEGNNNINDDDDVQYTAAFQSRIFLFLSIDFCCNFSLKFWFYYEYSGSKTFLE